MTMTNARASLASSVQLAIAQRDDALSQRDAALDDVLDLQRMLGIDKAFCTLANALRHATLAALHRWRRAASAKSFEFQLQIKPAHDALLLSRHHATEAEKNDVFAQLEAEEAPLGSSTIG